MPYFELPYSITMKCVFRNILITVVFCFLFGNAKGQYVIIPDPNFVNWLNSFMAFLVV